MDFVTQNLLGAVAAHAVVGRSCRDGGLGRLALLAGAAGGALPDFDFLLKPLADPALPWEYHRHFTHALVAIPVIGLLAAVPFLAFARGREQWRTVLAAATIGAATHGLLDNLTSYGTHLLWPFVAHRTAWDSMSIIDPVFTAVLLAGIVVALFRDRVRPTRLAMFFALAWIALGFLQHDRALDAQRALAAARGHAIVHGRVTPALGNEIVFRSVYEAEGRLWADLVRVTPFGPAGVRAGTSVPRFTEADLPARAGARARAVFRGLEAFADSFVARVDPAYTGDDRLVLGDMRLTADGNGFRALWGIAIDEAGEPAAWDAFPRRGDDAGAILAAIWADVAKPEGRFRTLGE